MPFLFKIALSATIIASTSWIAGKNPRIAGWIIALPISSMLALLFAQAEHRDQAKSIEFAQSILISVPLSLTFFVPFLFADRLKLGFFGLYALGVVFLTGSYLIQRWLLS
ncbi:MAG: hypothetical protein KGQ59_03260 [Bdellovibrionales bacterium]|nr:hypothetical protein [Bdellovibrionales bacterium]